MSQSQPPAPPAPPPRLVPLIGPTASALLKGTGTSAKEDGDGTHGTGSSFEYVHIDEEAIIAEIKSLGNQEYMRQLTQAKAVDGAPSEEGGSGMMVIVSAVLQPVLQNGPICGLAALAMVVRAQAHARQCHTQSCLSDELPPPPPPPIYEEALGRGFTKRGEMFSADNMTELAKLVLITDRDSDHDSVTVECVDTTSMTDAEIKDLILDNCLAGGFFLVPYDADRNHRPGLFKGHKAHWCVVMGCAALDANAVTNPTPMEAGEVEEPVILKVVCTSTLRTSGDAEEDRIKNLFKGSKGDEIFVVTRQSKSKHVGLWPLRDLLRSNANLVEIAPQILAESHEYMLAPIENNLRNKIVLIKLNSQPQHS